MHYKVFLFLTLLAVCCLTACPVDNDDDVVPGAHVLRLSAETSRPSLNLFLQNCTDDDYISLTVRRINNLDSDRVSSFKVDYTITDIFGIIIKEESVEFIIDDRDVQTQHIPMDKSRLGHFTFTASVKGGPRALNLPRQGTRPSGFITYAVLVDPQVRRQKAPYPDPDVDKYIFFGMYLFQETFGGVNLSDYLGVDASISGQLQWRNAFNTGSATDINKINQWVEEPWRATTLRQTIYQLGELTAYIPEWARTPAGQGGWYGGELNDYGEQELITYMEGMARIHIAAAPARPFHYFQILWEPVDWWIAWTPGGDRGDRALVKVYELAYQAVHRVYAEKAEETGDDSWRTKAVVLGPTYSDTADMERMLNWHERMFELGLANYIDGLSIHPYNDEGTNHITGYNNDAELAHTIKAMMDMTIDYYNNRTSPKLYDRPFFWGTEQGLREAAAANGPIRQATRLTRQNLVMLGEGFDANHVFCFADYNYNERYGYFYNHSTMETSYGTYAPNVVSPKQVTSAFAATTWLLKGFISAGRVSGLGGTNFGYKYTDTESSAVIYALWNYADGVSDTVTIPVGADQVTVFDITGNAQTVTSPGGNLTITLTEYVQYVKVE